VGSTFVLAASQWELFVSDDGGLTWELLALGLPTGLHDVEGVGDLFLARDQAGAISYWSADGKIWQEAQGVASTSDYATPDYAVGPAGILSGIGPGLDVTLSVDGTVWSELLPTMGLSGNYLRVAGRGDQYLAWPRAYPPSRIHSSVDGLTWTTSDIAVSMPPDGWEADIDEVRWNGAQYVLLGARYVYFGEWGDYTETYMIARSCNGRVWDSTTICSSDIAADHARFNTYCGTSFASTAAMTVVVHYSSTINFNQSEWEAQSGIRYSADLVNWVSSGVSWEHALTTVVVGDPS
jgi:hypothetical protein